MADLKLKVETWPIERVINYARNARLHSESQVASIAASIKEFGFINPCLVDPDGMLIAGHGRVMASKHLGLETIPVIKLGHLTENQIRALRIADNAIPLAASWSAELLRVELNELSEAGYDMPLLGFDDVQLVTFMSIPSGADPEKTPEPPAKPVSRTGDLWLLGKHRILCGDSTKAEDVERVLDGKKPHLMVTDPPYGVDYDPNWRNEPEKLNVKSKTVMVKKTKAIGKVVNDDRADWQQTWALFPGEVVYVWCGERQSVDMARQLAEVGIETRNLIVWAKAHHVISRGHYHPQHETCWYGVRKGSTAHWSGDRSQSTLWAIPNLRTFGREDGNVETGHGTQKPVECMRRPIQNNSKPGDYVYEPFSGSGTTIIAAEMMNRYCLAIELAENYVDVAVTRWQDFSKGTATLDGDGRTFAEIAKARAGRQKPSRSADKQPTAPRRWRARSPAASPG